MADQSDIEQAVEDAQTLMDAAAIFERMIEEADGMLDKESLPDDEETEEMRESMETAKEACQMLSMSMTIALAQEGIVPDFDDPHADDDGDDDMPSPTFG